jgi:hypothetical protein
VKSDLFLLCGKDVGAICEQIYNGAASAGRVVQALGEWCKRLGRRSQNGGKNNILNEKMDFLRSSGLKFLRQNEML